MCVPSNIYRTILIQFTEQLFEIDPLILLFFKRENKNGLDGNFFHKLNQYWTTDIAYWHLPIKRKCVFRICGFKAKGLVANVGVWVIENSKQKRTVHLIDLIHLCRSIWSCFFCITFESSIRKKAFISSELERLCKVQSCFRTHTHRYTKLSTF